MDDVFTHLGHEVHLRCIICGNRFKVTEPMDTVPSAPPEYREPEAALVEEAASVDSAVEAAREMTSEPEGESVMATPQYKCVEPGCEKHRVKNKRCMKHSKEFMARQEQSELIEKPEPVAEAPGGAEPEAEASPAAPPRRSLLDRVKTEQEPEKQGIFLDFTGREALFIRIGAESDDPAADIFKLIEALFDGDLFARREVFER